MGIFLAIQLSHNKPRFALIKKDETWHILRKHFQIFSMNYSNLLLKTIKRNVKIWFSTFSSQCSILIPLKTWENRRLSGGSKGNLEKKRVNAKMEISYSKETSLKARNMKNGSFKISSLHFNSKSSFREYRVKAKANPSRHLPARS